MTEPRMPTRQDYLDMGVEAAVLDNPPVHPERKLRPAKRNRVARRAELMALRQLKIQAQWEARIGEERDRVFALIERASPYLDAVTIQNPARGWLPSFKLKLIFWVVRSGPNPDNSFIALNTIERLLDIARERFREGLDPDPWLGPVEAEEGPE